MKEPWVDAVNAAAGVSMVAPFTEYNICATVSGQQRVMPGARPDIWLPTRNNGRAACPWLQTIDAIPAQSVVYTWRDGCGGRRHSDTPRYTGFKWSPEKTMKPDTNMHVAN